MRYSCSVCGMNHSRPCEVGLGCGINRGIPMVPRRRGLNLAEVLRRCGSMLAALIRAGDR